MIKRCACGEPIGPLFVGRGQPDQCVECRRLGKQLAQAADLVGKPVKDTEGNVIGEVVSAEVEPEPMPDFPLGVHRLDNNTILWVLADTEASAEYEERQRMVAEQCDEGVHEFEERMVQEMGEMSLPTTVCRWCGISQS